MKPTETVLLTEYVKACCPPQTTCRAETAADAWHDLLGELELGDCRDAVVMIAKRQPFVAPSEIITEVRRIREERISRTPPPAPPAELLDDEAAYRDYLRRTARQAASAPEQRRAIGGTP